jgi:hypothetical protein
MEKQKYPVKSPQGKKILEEDKAAISSRNRGSLAAQLLRIYRINSKKGYWNVGLGGVRDGRI